jgi:hypothetical protein
MARRHPTAVAIKQHPGEQAWLLRFSARLALGRVAGELGLDRIPEQLIDNRLMFANIGLFVVNDPLTDLTPTPAQRNHRYARFRWTSSHSRRSERMPKQ